MAWLGSNLASIKSQITNFTKEVLIESSGDEPKKNDSDEFNTNEKLKILETICESEKSECERLKNELSAIAEKAENSEYQTKKITSQYRALLETKEDEIQELKRRIEEQAAQLSAERQKDVTDRVSTPTKKGSSTTNNTKNKEPSSSSISDVGDWSDWDAGDDNANAKLSAKKQRPNKLELAAQMEQKEREINAFKDQLQHSKAQYVELEGNLRSLNEENDSLREKLYNAIKAEGLHIAELKDLKTMMDANQERLDGLAAENETFKTMLAEKNSDIMDLLKKMPSISTPSIEDQSLTALPTQNLIVEAELRAEIDILNERVQRLGQEKLALETAAAKEATNVKSAWCQTNQDEEGIDARHDHEVQTAVDRALEELKHQKERELEALRNELDMLADERDEYLHESTRVKEKLLEAEDEISCLEDENNALRDQLDEKNVEHREMLENIDHLEHRLSTSTPAPSVVNEERAIQTEYIESVDDTNANEIIAANALLTSQITSLNLALEKSNQETDELQTSNKILEARNTELQVQLREAEARHGKLSDSLGHEITDKQEQIDLLTQSLETLKSDLDQAKFMNANLVHQHATLEATNTDVKVQLDNKEEEMRKLTGQLDDALATIESYKKMLDDGEQQRLLLETKVKTLEKELSDAQSNHETFVEQKGATIAEFSTQMTSLKEMLHARENEIQEARTDLAQQRELYESQIAEMQQNFQELEATLKKMSLTNDDEAQRQTVMAQMQSQFEAQLKATSDKYEHDIGALNEKISQVQAQYDIALKRQEEAKAEVIIAHETAIQYKERVEEIQARDVDQQKLIQDLQTSIAQLTEQTHSYAAQLNEANNKIALLQKDIENVSQESQNQLDFDRHKEILTQSKLEVEQALTEQKQRNEKLANENARLKTHLLEMEENSSADAMTTQDRERELREKLTDFETISKRLQTQLNENNLKYDTEVCELRQTLSQVSGERDRYHETVQELQNEISSLQNQITNVQSVLERVQQEKDEATSFQLSASQNKIRKLETEIADMNETIKSNENDIKKFQALSKSYSFLNQKLADRENGLNEAKRTNLDKEKMIEHLKSRIEHLEKIQGSAIEREVIKNLFMSYLNAPNERQRIEIGFLMGKILQFTSVEIEKLNYQTENAKGWGLSSLWRSSPTPQGDLASTDKGLGELFIQFLEKESIERPVPKFNLKLSPPPSYTSANPDIPSTENFPESPISPTLYNKPTTD